MGQGLWLLASEAGRFVSRLNDGILCVTGSSGPELGAGSAALLINDWIGGGRKMFRDLMAFLTASEKMTDCSTPVNGHNYIRNIPLRDARFAGCSGVADRTPEYSDSYLQCLAIQWSFAVVPEK